MTPASISRLVTAITEATPEIPVTVSDRYLADCLPGKMTIADFCAIFDCTIVESFSGHKTTDRQYYSFIPKPHLFYAPDARL